MHKKGKRILACLLAAVMMVLPLTAMADPSEEGEVTQAMTRSERQIQNILAESTPPSRRNYSPILSLPACSTPLCAPSQARRTAGWAMWTYTSAIWTASRTATCCQQCLVQYGMKSLPAETGTCTLKLGAFLHSVEFNKQAVFTFPNEDLGDDALPEASACPSAIRTPSSASLWSRATPTRPTRRV